MINELRIINERFIEINKDNPQELQKHILIKEILKQDNCFMNMSIEYAYSILRDLQIQESDLKRVYLQLI